MIDNAKWVWRYCKGCGCTRAHRWREVRDRDYNVMAYRLSRGWVCVYCKTYTGVGVDLIPFVSSVSGVPPSEGV